MMRSWPFVLSILMVAAPASATSEFPKTIVTHLAITCDGGASPIFDKQGCTICHLTNNGGLGTVQHPFGIEMRKLGVTQFNDNALDTALDQAQTEGLDSNCDGIADTTQLSSCDWPSLVVNHCDGGTANDGGLINPTENVLYGCSTSPVIDSPALPVFMACVLSGTLALAIVRKRRKRA